MAVNIFIKSRAVIDSCVDCTQLVTAFKYISNAFRRHYINHDEYNDLFNVILQKIKTGE